MFESKNKAASSDICLHDFRFFSDLINDGETSSDSKAIDAHPCNARFSPISMAATDLSSVDLLSEYSGMASPALATFCQDMSSRPSNPERSPAPCGRAAPRSGPAGGWMMTADSDAAAALASAASVAAAAIEDPFHEDWPFW